MKYSCTIKCFDLDVTQSFVPENTIFELVEIEASIVIKPERYRQYFDFNEKPEKYYAFEATNNECKPITSITADMFGWCSDESYEIAIYYQWDDIKDKLPNEAYKIISKREWGWDSAFDSRIKIDYIFSPVK